jgi:hypothetical protein
MAKKYTISKNLVDQIRENGNTIRNTGHSPQRTFNRSRNQDSIVFVTGRAETASGVFSGYPSNAYAGYEVALNDSNEFIDISGRVFGDEALSTSLGPIINVSEFSNIYVNNDQSDQQLIPPSSYIRAFRYGNTTTDISGYTTSETQWYCNEDQFEPNRNFSSYLVNVSGEPKLEVHSGNVYSNAGSTFVSGNTFDIAVGDTIFVRATADLSAPMTWSAVTQVQSTSSFVYPIVTTGTERTLSIKLAKIDSEYNIDVYHDGDINLVAYQDRLFSRTDTTGTSGAFDLTYDTEAELSAQTVSGWDIHAQEDFVGVDITVQVGTIYDHTLSTPQLSGITRDLKFDENGKLSFVGPKQSYIIDDPTSCV